MARHSRKAHRKTHRKPHRKGSRKAHSRRQRGGGWGFTGPAFAPADGMAPEAARALTDDCAITARPAPSVTQTGAWSQAGGGCGCASVLAPTPQQGGGMFDWLLGKKAEDKQAIDQPEIPVSEAAMTPENPVPMNENPVQEVQSGGKRRYRKRRQHGGGGGGGGYGFTLDNSLGKVFAATPVGPCPQKGGNAEALVSYPAGYGYAPASAMEVGNGSAHFLAQIPYGKQCMGGGRRTTRRKGARRATGRSGRRTQCSRARKSHRKSRRHH